MEISHHRDSYQMTDLLIDLIGFMGYSTDYELVGGLHHPTNYIYD